MKKTVALDEDENLLEEKLTSFLNRWARHDLVPQFEEVLRKFRQNLMSELKQKLQAIRDHAGVIAVSGQRAKTDVDCHKRSVIGREVDLRLTTWDDSRLRSIETEDLAAVAFDASDSLKAEFREKGVFLSYWRRLRAV